MAYIFRNRNLQTQYGDIYNCVDLYKQPAFQHPVLKHHKIKMRPTFSEQKKVSDKSSPSNLRFGLKEECPAGTVPIRRTTRKEQLQAKAIFRQLFQGSSLSNDQQQTRFAGISTIRAPYKKFKHAEGHFSTHNPEVGKGQLSASVVSVEYGPPSIFSTIRVGWMVYPDLYNGDNRTRLYTAWGQFRGDPSTVDGCFNTYCPGFVQTNPNIPLDMVIQQISIPSREYYYYKIGLNMDTEDGTWYLTHGENDELVGHWPNDLFLGLKDGADTVKWGGLVSTTTPMFPMMGSGLLGQLGSLFRQIGGDFKLEGESSLFLNGTVAENIKAPLTVVENRCYRAGFNNYSGPYWGSSFWCGGNAGDVQQCPQN